MESLLKAIFGILGAIFGALFAAGAAAAVVYAVYKITVVVLDKTSIIDAIRRALNPARDKYSNQQLKGTIKALYDNGNVNLAKVDVLDRLTNEKKCEVEISYQTASGLYEGYVIDRIAV